jgi:hypothetical protein
LSETYQQRVHEIGDLLVTLDDAPPPCEVCGRALQVQKTRRRRGVTLAHGTFHVQERVYVCPSGCERPGHAPTLAALLPPRSVVGYDVMAAVGLDRFVHYQQREEIRAKLAHDHGVRLSTGEISSLEQRFLAYLQALHDASRPALAAALRADGGWPLHLDATCEDGRGTLLVAYTSWRHWTLGAWKIPTERKEFVLAAVQEIAEAFGPPCGIMRDLGRAMTEAADEFVSTLDQSIPVLACHQHLLADVGEDLLRKGHDRLRTLFRQAEVLPSLRAFVRQRGERLGPGIDQARQGLHQWLADSAAAFPDGPVGLTAARSLGQWVLDHHADTSDEGFPFDTPYLALYDRCLQLAAATGAFLRQPPADRAVKRSLERLQQILAPIDADVPPFVSVATSLTRRVELFTRLRHALRLNPKDPDQVVGSSQPASVSRQDLQDIRRAIHVLEVSLKKQRQAAAHDTELCQGIEIILSHLERHRRYLWGHAITIGVRQTTTVRLVPRTNNCLESCFHGMKRKERRRSGRKALTQDFESMPAAAALAMNLTCADYVQIVCGSLQRLPAAFARLDADNRFRSVASSARPPALGETASLSSADRRLVRTPALGDRILAAAQAR